MKKMILFVDDERSFLDGLNRVLHGFREEWDMVFACDARAALKGTETNDFDAIICDIRMPGMDGFEFLSAVRESERTRDIPVIILTGSGETHLKRRALNEGATDLLNKPVDSEDLVARIRSALRLKEYQDRIRRQNIELEQRVQERTRQLEALNVDVLWRLARVSEYHDIETGDHILRIGMYARILARAMELPEDFAEQLMLTSPLHDIGKVAVPDEILMKLGKLTDEERRIMQRHCGVGAEILRHDSARTLFTEWRKARYPEDETPEENPLLLMAGGIAMCHHERWDGSGYPMRLKGEEIPLEARITAVADVFDALTSKRSYKPALSNEEALAVLQRDAHLFDPAVLAAFENAFLQIAEFQGTFGRNAMCEAN